MQTSVRLFLATLFFAGVALSLQFKRGHAKQPEVIREPASMETRIPAEEKKQTYFYRFERKINSSLVKFEFAGTVQMDLLEKSVGHETWAIAFTIGAPGAHHTYTSRRPVLLETNGQGELLSLKTVPVKSRDDAEELNVFKDFVSLFVYRYDRDTTGKYRMRWKDSNTGGEKNKLEYLGDIAKNMKVTKSTHRVIINANDEVVQSIEGEDVLSLMAGKDEMRSWYRIRRDRVESTGKTPRIALGRDWSNTTLALESVSSDLDVRPFAELSGQLKEIRNLSRSKRLRFFHELVKSLKADPTEVSNFRAQIEAMREQTGVMTFAVGVLATVGNDESQNVLVDWFRGYGQSEAKLGHAILNAFSTTEAALTDDTRKFLLKISDDQSRPDMAQNAAFALGAGLRHSNDPSARDKLISLFYSAQSDSHRAAAVDAMGNSGDGSFLPALIDALKSTNRSIREKAAFASRFMENTHAQVIVREALKDQHASVRSSAMKACALRGDPSCKSTLR